MVYIDNFNAPFGRMVMCHMIADTTAELLAMVRTIGVNTKWIQDAGTYNEHFDISLGKKALALKAGAVEIPMLALGRVLLRRPGHPMFKPEYLLKCPFCRAALDTDEIEKCPCRVPPPSGTLF